MIILNEEVMIKKYRSWLLVSLTLWLSTHPLYSETIYGKGVVTFEVRNLPSFKKVVAYGASRVYFGEVEENLVKVEAESNLLAHISTRVEDGILYLDPGKDIKPSRPIKFYLATKELEAITTYGTVQLVNRSPLQADKLELTAYGISKMEIPELFCNHLKVELFGSSSLYLKGAAKSQSVNMTGATDYKAIGLLSDEAKVVINGAGKATVNAKDRLVVDLSGAAYLGYEGHPEVEKKVTGVGKLEQLP